MLDHGTVIAGYHLEEVLGRGGMGTVFRARHVESGRVVALKLVEDGDRARGEGRAQAALDHPHAVTVYESGDSEAGLYLAMQLVDGPSLAELMQERSVSVRRALDLLGQVADALDAAHARGLVHRDVKPHNVLVGPGDHAYLADFGLTRLDAQTALTAPGAMLGTVAYLAPEVIRGGEAGPAADRYAFAAMAFECLSGTVVFPRPSDAAMLHAHASDPPPPVSARRPELGDGLDDVLERALAKDPSDRPPSAARLVAELRRRMERSGTIGLPAPPPAGGGLVPARDATTDAALALPKAPPPAPAARSRRRLVVTAVVAALVGAALVGAVWLASDEDAGETLSAVPADPPGLRFVGTDLAGAPGRPLDCRGRATGPASPACTVVQSALPGATVVVPANGAIRRWGVRGARGELTLAVLRPREDGAFQVALSQTETVGSADVHWFAADMEVERGDLVGLRVTPGSAVGVRDGVAGAATERWLPPLGGFGRPPDRAAGTGLDREVLLRVGVRPGARQQAPAQITGAAADALPDGTVRRRGRVRLEGRSVEMALVRVDDRFVLDQRVGGRRVARIDVPGMRPGAEVVRFLAASWAPDLAGVDISFVNEESAHVAQLTYEAQRGAFRRLR